MKRPSSSPAPRTKDRNADRIAQQTKELETLVKQRDALLKK
jgi:hypothetical protein